MVKDYSSGILSLIRKCENISGDKRHMLFAYVLLGVFIFLRRPDALMNAQPWAEDGNIFLQQAIQGQLESIIVPYAGYLHVVPRLVTLLALQFGLGHAPLIMNLAALAISAACCAYVFGPGFRFLIRNDLLRLVLATLIACAPISEIWMNVTNVQWFLLIYAALWTTRLLFDRKALDEKPDAWFLAHVLLLCLAFLSTPLSFILAPGLAVGLALRIREVGAVGSKALLALFSAACLLGHIAFCAVHLGARQGGSLSAIAVLHFICSEVLSWFVLLGPNSWFVNMGYVPLYAAAAVITIVLAFAAARHSDRVVDLWLFLLIALCILVLVVQRQDYLSIYASDVLQRGIAGRYSFLPMILFLVLVMREVDLAASAQKRVGIVAIVSILLLLIFAVNAATHYEQKPFTDMGFSRYAALYDPKGTGTETIPINPPGWSMEVPARANAGVAYLRIPGDEKILTG